MSTEARDGDATIIMGHLIVIRRTTGVNPHQEPLQMEIVQLLLHLRGHGDVETVAQEVHLPVLDPVPVPTMEDVTKELREEEIGDVRRVRIGDLDARETPIHLKSHRQEQVTQEQPLMEPENLHRLQ